MAQGNRAGCWECSSNWRLNHRLTLEGKAEKILWLHSIYLSLFFFKISQLRMNLLWLDRHRVRSHVVHSWCDMVKTQLADRPESIHCPRPGVYESNWEFLDMPILPVWDCMVRYMVDCRRLPSLCYSVVSNLPTLKVFFSTPNSMEV